MKAHLSVLLGLLALVKAAGYWLQRFELTVSTRGFVDGAGYTDVKAQLPAINLLLLISIASFVLFIVNIWRRGWMLPVLGVGLWALVAVVAGAIYPQFIQRFQVTPNEPREGAALHRAQHRGHPGGHGPRGRHRDRCRSTLDDRQRRRSTSPPTQASVANIRLWDPSPAVLGKTFPQLQQVRDYYRINDVDVDRYELDGEPTQVVLSVRDLNTAERAADVVGGPAPHLHARLRRDRGAGQRQGRRAASPSFVAKDVPVRQPTTTRARAHPAGGLLRRGARRLRDHGLQAAASSTTRTTRAPQYADLRRRRRRAARQRRSAGPPSPCASATPTR